MATTEPHFSQLTYDEVHLWHINFAMFSDNAPATLRAQAEKTSHVGKLCCFPIKLNFPPGVIGEKKLASSLEIPLDTTTLSEFLVKNHSSTSFSTNLATWIAKRYYNERLPLSPFHKRRNLSQAETYTLAYSGRKKPYFLPPSPLKFSITHSHDQLFLAYTRRGALGIDLEFFAQTHYPAKPSIRQLLKVAQRFFTPAEAAILHNMQPTAKQNKQARQQDLALRKHFFYLWTRKEAYAKALDIPLFTAMKKSESAMLADVRLLPVLALAVKPAGAGSAPADRSVEIYDEATIAAAPTLKFPPPINALLALAIATTTL